MDILHHERNEERLLELAFEGDRPYDLYRNNLSMVRAYPDMHGTDQFNLTIDPSDNRVIFLIPEHEMLVNPNIVQNQ